MKLTEYEKAVEKATERFPEKKDSFSTASGIKVSRVYAGKDAETEFPGLYPYTRGIQPTMYRSRLWTMRQYAGFGSAEKTNERFKYLMKEGQTGLSVAFDLPTQLGYDSDNPLCRGEVGKVGVAIDTIQDLENVFDGIPLDRISTSMTINATAAIILAMYIAIAEKRGISLVKLRGTIQNDILKEYYARGTYIFPPDRSMKLITDIFSYCSDNMPGFNTISVSGYHAREAGCTAVQELAYTFSDAVEYVNAAKSAGLAPDDLLPRLSFFFSVDNDFFEEIAKFRAARRIWAKLAKEKLGASNTRSMKLRFHCQTSGASLQAAEPENNIVRVTMQALAAVLGGTQSLHTNSKDEALALPTEESVRTALRTQQIIAKETNVASVVDPLGGSHYIEYLTDEIENQVFAMIKNIEQKGGMIACIGSGYIQHEISKKAYQYQKDIESGKKEIIGRDSGQFSNIPIFVHDSEVEKGQITRLSAVKQRRDKEKVLHSLNRLKRAANGADNLMPFIVDCVIADATVQEITDVLRDVFGEYKPVSIL